MLLILTSDKDLAADFLIVHLIKKGLPYFRLNAEELHRAHAIYRHDGSSLSHHGQTIDTEQIHAVWYRRAICPRVPETLPVSQRHFAAGEARHFWQGLLLGLNAIWVNPIDKVSVAEHKLHQLRIARKIGFNLPNTIVSRDAAALRKFSQDFTSVVCKPIYHGLFVDETGRYSSYTRRIEDSDLSDSEAISTGPVLLQQEIQRISDIRVTIIGDRCFSVRIESDDPCVVDWRKPSGTLRYRAFELDKEIERKCREMLDHLGLLYGAFDFIESKSGDLFFLEVNPTGEWAWLEDTLELPMREAFVELLYGDGDCA